MPQINIKSLLGHNHQRLSLLFIIILVIKFLIFDILWCIPTTFKPLSMLDTYLSLWFVVMVMALPVRMFKMWKLNIVIMVLLDILLISNLMYYRTYYSAIPLANYSEVGNLGDFMGSVWDSLRWVDLVFPISSAAAVFIGRRYKDCNKESGRRYMAVLGIIALLLMVSIGCKGGYRKCYNQQRQQAYLCSSMPVVYTVFGSVLYDWLDSKTEITPQIRAQIDEWLSRHPQMKPIDNLDSRHNCIVILCESLESWVIGQSIEGQEITPNLNRIINEAHTIYAPNVLTQVKGGRSIDAQLMIFAGLLPISNGTYSSQYQHNTYFTLQKAMRRHFDARSYLLTIDKPSTWNQGQVAQAFGMDTIISYTDFELDEAFGTHKRTGDRAFMRQCANKIASGEIWPENENVMLTMVTYSGHAPFKLPEELREIGFSDAIPQKMADYMMTAHYTDSAIGEFVQFLKGLPQYHDTMIVITGDHEGLADWRNDILQSKAAQGVVSSGHYTPLIVVNAPVDGFRYDNIMGQIDIYPTILNLLNINDYQWQGLGQSIFDFNKVKAAISPTLHIAGDSVSEMQKRHLQQSFDISDKIIRYDYLSERK